MTQIVNNKNRIVTVIGGSGFIGSHVADQLSEEGYQVRIFDLKESPWKKSEQKMIVGDLLDKNILNKAVSDAEAVYNFAALADLNQARNKPIETVETNILGNVQVLEACRINAVKRFIYASTVYVHSREGGFYRCSKQAAEAYVEEYQKVFNLDYTILRYGSLYGPRADETNGMWRIIHSALKNGKLRYEGNYNSMREYIHVEDAARASVDILNDEFKNESIVLTGQEPMRVIDMLKMLAEILDISEDLVEFVDADDIGHYVRTPYSYQPKLGRKYIPPIHVDLGQGLLQMINEESKKNIE